MKRAIFPYRGGVLSTLALWLGLAALMVQGLAPLCSGAAMAGSGSIASIVICTLHGSQTLQLDADGKALPNAPAKQASDCCTVCHAPNGFTTPPPIFEALRSNAMGEAVRSEAAPIILPRSYSSYVSRGPPVATMRHALA
jgi:hypothetical protein